MNWTKMFKAGEGNNSSLGEKKHTLHIVNHNSVIFAICIKHLIFIATTLALAVFA